MSTKTIYVCEYCKKRSDADLLIRISSRARYEQVAHADWGIYIGAGATPHREASFGHDVHLCSARCLVLWLGLSVEDAKGNEHG